MKSGTTTDSIQGHMIDVVGTFKIKSRFDQGKLYLLYYLEDAKIISRESGLAP